jgi:hypothetical protein
MPSLNWAGFCRILVLAGFASHLASNPGRLFPEQQKEEMKNESITLFASVDQKATSISDIACIPLEAAATVGKLDLNRNSILVLQRVRALGYAGGPYAVYIAAEGVGRPAERNRLAEFSLYSVQQRSDSQELSFDVKPALLRSLLSSQPAASHLQVCVEDRSPSPSAKTSPSLSFDKALLVQLQHD